MSRDVPDTKAPWAARLQKLDAYIDFKPLTARSAQPWIQRMARERGASIAAADAAYLFEYTGGDLQAADSETAKLAAYVGEGGRIGMQEIERVCVASFEFKVFQMLDAFLSGQPAKGLGMYMGSLEEGESPMMILTLLSGQLRVARFAASASAEGITAEQIAASLDVRAFVAEKALRSFRKTPVEKIRALEAACARADLEYKTGIRGDREALEGVLFQLAQDMGRKHAGI